MTGFVIYDVKEIPVADRDLLFWHSIYANQFAVYQK